MDIGAILSKNVNAVLDSLEYAFDQESIDGVKEITVNVPAGDLGRAKIDIVDFSSALHFLKERFPYIKREYVYDFVNGENPDPREQYLDPELRTIAKITLPADFKIRLKEIRDILGVPVVKFKLADVKVSYDPKTATILAGERLCPLPPDKNERILCKMLFDEKPGVAVDWIKIAEEMLGLDFEKLDKKKHRKAVQDTGYRTNDRLIALGAVGKLFKWKDNSVIRNF